MWCYYASRPVSSGSMLELLFNVFRRKKKRPPAHSTEESRAKRKESYAHYSGELRSLRGSITDHNVKFKAKELYLLVKSAFRDSLSLKYEATFQEIEAEINARHHFPDTMREEISQFLEELAVMEYGYEEFRQIVTDEKNKQEKALREYISDLEKEGEHIRKTTKRKINEIVSEKVPHSEREFLLKIVDKFDYFLRHIF